MPSAFPILTATRPPNAQAKSGLARGDTHIASVSALRVSGSLPPVIAALVLDQLGGYRVLFAFAGVFTFLGAMSVYRIKSIR